MLAPATAPAFEIVPAPEVDHAVRVFLRDGFVAVAEVLSPQQLAVARRGATRVIAQQTAAVPLAEANRGYARYSLGPQHHHPEWAQLIDCRRCWPRRGDLGQRRLHLLRRRR